MASKLLFAFLSKRRLGSWVDGSRRPDDCSRHFIVCLADKLVLPSPTKSFQTLFNEPIPMYQHTNVQMCQCSNVQCTNTNVATYPTHVPTGWWWLFEQKIPNTFRTKVSRAHTNTPHESMRIGKKSEIVRSTFWWPTNYWLADWSIKWYRILGLRSTFKLFLNIEQGLSNDNTITRRFCGQSITKNKVAKKTGPCQGADTIPGFPSPNTALNI